MSLSEFHDRLQRSLTGELSEAEALQLHREILNDPAALEEFLAAREMDHDLKRLLAPGSGDDDFLRGVLNSRSAGRPDPEAFVRSVTRAHSARAVARRSSDSHRFVLLAAGVLGAAFLWWLFSTGSQPVDAPSTARPKTSPELPKIEDPVRPTPEPVKNPAPRPERRPDPAPTPEPKKEESVAREKTSEPEPPREKVNLEPPVSPSKSAPRPTVTAFATVQKVKGDVFVFTGTPAKKSPATEGQPLAPGQGVLTEGSQSSALVARQDAVRVTLGIETQIRFAEARSEIGLVQGKVDVEADPREAGHDVLLTTPHAEVRIQACRLSLTATSTSTGIEVHQGTALFTNVLDGRAMEVKAGGRAQAQEIPGVDRKRVDEALRKGIAYLKSAPSQGADVFGIANCDELILLTLLSAGVGEHDPDLQRVLKNVLAAPLGRTYLVSLQAMALEELDRVKYQDRIAECAQFLVDNQCATGQWTYGGTPTPVTFASEIPKGPATPTEAAPLKEAGPDLFGRRAKPTVIRKLQLKKTRSGPAQGDNSNAQYAALGLRACAEAGIAIPAETLQLAAGWWRKVQYTEDAGRAVASGEGGPARGWCYNDGKNPVNGGPCCVGAYASMTAGAVSSLMIYDHLLGTDWKKDVAVRLGMNWMTTYFTVTRNLGMDVSFKTVNGGTTPPETYHYYGLYALERVGIFSAQEKLGRHAWYAEGAKFILGKQKPDGSWSEASPSSHPTWDTCFAILFLRRATRPLQDVPSVDKFIPKVPADK